MGVATGFTAVRMKKIEDETVVSGHVNQATKELILTTRAGVAIPAGNVEGPQGPPGIQGLPGIVRTGTTAQRDVKYPLPSTDPTRVALANQVILWYNTTKGYVEAYYATTGLTGLLVPGLPAGTISGWYPLIETGIPYGHMGMTGGFQQMNGGVDTPILFAAAQELRGGMLASDPDDCLIVPLTGRYRVHLKAYFSGSSTETNTVRMRLNGVSAASGVRGGVYEKLLASANKVGSGDIFIHSTGIVPLNAGDKVGMVAQTAVSVWGTTGYNGSCFEVEWVSGP